MRGRREWRMPWPEPKSVTDDDGPGPGAMIEKIGGHFFQISPSRGFAEVPTDSGRRRYRVLCITCSKIVHEGTISCSQMIEQHLDTAALMADAADRAVAAPMNAEPDSVNHPAHYQLGGLEVIDVIETWQLGFCEGNIIKYVARARRKGRELEDLKKARWYLDRLIGKLEEKEV